MASVRKRDPSDPKSPWIVEYTDAAGVRRRKTPRSGLKKDADALRQQIERELGDGVHMAPAASITVAELATLWLADCDRRASIGDGMSKMTVYRHKSMVATHIGPAFPGVKVSEVDHLEITRWLNAKRERYAKRTVDRLHQMLGQILGFGVQTRRAKRNVMLDFKVRSPGGSKPRTSIPSLADARHLLDVVSERPYRGRALPHLNRQVIVKLALFCGMRSTEIAALQWEHVRFERGVIQIRHSYNSLDGLKTPKSEAGWRDVTMNTIVLDALLTVHSHYGSPAKGHVVLSEGGLAIPPKSYWTDIWDPLIQRAGFKDSAGKNKFTLHGLRHACVSLLIADGLSPLHIKTFIGHSNVSTTLNIYGHLFPEDERVKTSVDSVARLFDATETRQRLITN